MYIIIISSIIIIIIMYGILGLIIIFKLIIIDREKNKNINIWKNC